MVLIRQADWTEQLCPAGISRALTLELSFSVTLTGVLRVGGAAVRLTVVAMEGGMVMINVVTSLNTCSFAVDKNKSKASSRQQPPQRQASQPSQSNGPPDVVPLSVPEGGRKDQQLRELLAVSNCRFEALTIVLQQVLAEV